jgi:hypothetical protein
MTDSLSFKECDVVAQGLLSNRVRRDVRRNVGCLRKMGGEDVFGFRLRGRRHRFHIFRTIPGILDLGLRIGPWRVPILSVDFDGFVYSVLMGRERSIVSQVAYYTFPATLVVDDQDSYSATGKSAVL